MGKLLKIAENDRREMEFDEVLEMYKPLLMATVYKFDNLNIELDDKYQIASIGLWNAYKHYDPEKNIGFGLLAKISVKRILKREYLTTHRQKRTGLTILSIDETTDNYDNEFSPIFNALKSDYNMENDVILRDALKNFFDTLEEYQIETIKLYASGKRYNEISKILNLAPSTIRMRMLRVRDQFNKFVRV